MKKLTFLLCSLVLIGLIAGACGGAAPTATPVPPTPTKPPPTATPVPAAPTPTTAPAKVEPYKIGAFFSVTGPVSSLGVPERDTVQMLVEQFNEAGGVKGPDGLMHPLEVTIEDDQSDPTQAVLIVKKLIEEQKVPIIIGGTGSPQSIAVVDTVQGAKIPFISVASSSKIVTPVEERFWVFKTPQQNLPVAQVQADYLKANGITKVASIYVNNAFGEDSRQALKAVAAEAGIAIVDEESFEPGDTDMTAQLTRIAGTDAQALIVHATPGEGAPLTVQFRDLGLGIPILHNHGIGNKAFIDLAGEAANGVLFPIGKLLVARDLPDTDPQKAVLLKYIEDYTQYTGNAPSTFGGHAWDAMHMAVMAFEKVGPEPAKMRDYLEGIKNFAGISGVFNMSAKDHTGIGKESLVLVRIVDGQWVYVSPAEYAEKREAEGPPNIPHEVAGREQCLVCHEQGVAGAPKVPDDHSGRTNEMCQACHKSAEAEMEGDPAKGAQVFTTYGCNACHSVEAGVTLVGPSLFNISAQGDKHYIEESIVDPSAEIANGFADGIMPKDYGTKISEDELEDLIAYLLSLK